MKNILIFIITFSISGYCISQKTNRNTCTASLTLDPVYETVEKTHYIFTGSDTTGLNVNVTKITVVEGRKELVKRRINKDCVSPDPEDCMVKVMEDIPPVTMNLYTLSGPDVTKEYDTRTEIIKRIIKEGGQTKENVVCIKNRSANLIKKVQNALIGEGYPLIANGIMDQATNLSLTDFQKTKGLAYGDLSLATLAALGVK